MEQHDTSKSINSENSSISESIKKFGNKVKKPEIAFVLRTDAATDFTSKKFQNFLRKNNIHHFTTHNEKQANYVERFVQTIKKKIRRYMAQKQTQKYIDILQPLVDTYNRTWHSGIKSEPINVNKTNEKRLWWQMYWPEDKHVRKGKRKRNKFAYKVGDKDRISQTRTSFQREYDNKWTYEIFNISRRYIRQGQPIYVLTDWFGERIEGTFYQKELQKVDINQKPWKIEHTLDTDGVGCNTRYLVKWLGWPEKFNSWISLSDYNKLK